MTTITLYASDGTTIQTWTITGHVFYEDEPGFSFRTNDGKNIHVTGTIVVEDQ
ncbi:MAG: hypothetical protein GY838_13460 [bacterium]|nr:hypothetical protein [bacterium]